ncbi:hypothetical protein Cni_G03728 [Canna indica]|uniref:Syntaxin 6/10/61 N-terminal domain-containing protein n=1 Tax=Canna indica TaxID=4628 RepID=A0AAQ3JT27_9LILI|nr:hypothetical protein Cni_G03728 [Canna indica]
MAAGSSFDQWQKDVFFTAAEEVQESADVLESLYRMWTRNLKDGFSSDTSDELHGELHIALGTAKWQLEEFEKAVRLSHEAYPSEDNTINRHKQFIAAIASQVSRIEKALREERKHPLRWVQLDSEEQDDLALFLSAVPHNWQETRDKGSECNKLYSQGTIKPESVRGLKNTASVSNDGWHAVEMATRESLRRKDNEVCSDVDQLNGLRRTSSSVDVVAWKIVVADDADVDSKSVERTEMANHASILSSLSTRLRWFRNSLGKAKSEENPQLRNRLSNYLDLMEVAPLAQGLSRLTDRSRSCFDSFKEDFKASSSQQLAMRIGGFQRKIPGSQYYMQISRSLRIIFLLLLSAILIVPFVLYST